MGGNVPTTTPPFLCIFCEAKEKFSSEEHIVPHSLGNDLVVLAKGWVCDSCNNKFSAFENRVLSSSIFGAERCRMAVRTKRGRPAKAKIYNVSWFTEPSMPSNVVSLEAEWAKIPLLISADKTSAKLAFRVHDETNLDIARLLLKIGIEISAPLADLRDQKIFYDFKRAKEYLVSCSEQPWPYFVLLDKNAVSHLVSVFSELPDEHAMIRESGFDIFLHEIDGKPILFFCYGAFFVAICLTSPDTDWRSILLEWRASHVGCPIQYAHLCG